MSGTFDLDLQKAIQKYSVNNYSDNYDYRRFGDFDSAPLQTRIKHLIKKALETLGLRKTPIQLSLNANKSDLEWIYAQLEDEESKRLIVDVIAYRILGHSKVKLPLNTPDYWSKLEALEKKADTKDQIELEFFGWRLDRFDLQEEGYPIRLYARAPGVFTQLILQQYRCQNSNHAIEVGDGDTVIDCGGCYGDTALYFAHKAGELGRVFSFEFMPNNLNVFKRNLELNPELAKRIQIVPNPLWSASGEKLYIEGNGPGAHITLRPLDSAAPKIETLKIDDLVKRESVAKVGFIKMDIEGAEMEALKGSELTIRRDRPKLAISVYHKLEDIWEIPRWIDGLGLGYRFYLRHFTIHAEETVLFAEVSA
jgi:FkbM family methyltransferase